MKHTASYHSQPPAAQSYFDEVRAPYEKLCIMEDTTHGLLGSKSEGFSEILHEIAREQGAK